MTPSCPTRRSSDLLGQAIEIAKEGLAYDCNVHFGQRGIPEIFERQWRICAEVAIPPVPDRAGQVHSWREPVIDAFPERFWISLTRSLTRPSRSSINTRPPRPSCWTSWSP